jgi:hypothetical protein
MLMFPRRTFLLSLLLALPTPAFASAAPLNGISSSLTIYVYPPRHRLDWSTPAHALRSTMGNLLSLSLSMDDLVRFTNDFHEDGAISSRYKSSIGHTLNHLRCKLPDGKLYDHWASLSGQDFHQVDKGLLLDDKVGYGVLFHDYIDGHIIEGEENVKRITFYKGSHEDGERVRPRYIQMELNAEQCEEARRMITFFESFHFPPGTTLEQLEAKGPENVLYFTDQIDPYASYLERLRTGRGKVGGGCAPFAAALTKVTGHYLPEFDTLWRTPVTVSEKLIGGWNDPHIGKVRRVSLGSLLFSPLGSRWSYADEGYRDRHLNLYDPQRIWDFAGDVLDCLGNGQCQGGAKTFIRARRAAIRPGVTQVFRDNYDIDVQRGEDHETQTLSVTQPVSGFVWRQR